MKPFTRIAVLLLIFGVAAIAVRADSAPVSSTGLGDFKVILNDPTCPSGTDCIDIGVTARTLSVLFFAPPTPILIPAGQTAACDTNFGKCTVFFPGDGDGDSDDYFYGVLFYDFSGGPLKLGDDLDIGVSGITNFALTVPDGVECEPGQPCQNGVMDFAAPEPPTVLLLLAGLPLLVILRRRALRVAPNLRA
jgi:hypothetical protein